MAVEQPPLKTPNEHEGGTRAKEEWQFWIDRGGTFTDIVARRGDGVMRTHKLLSENPERYPDAALQGIRDVLGVDASEPIPAENIDAIKMGTTVATNALLERKGEAVAFVTTRGFGDALKIGYQNRPRLFDRNVILPAPLYARVIEIDERRAADGALLIPLDEGALRTALQAAFDDGLRAVAIVFMHGYRYPDHERRAGAIARDVGFTQVSLSHEASPLIKFVGRGDTAVVDAYLSPILRRYVDKVAAEVGDARLMFMQSNGGLTAADRFQGKDAILSGPAGGVVGMVRTAKMAGFDKIIGFDMGGTSTDVSHFSGAYERVFETQVAGARLRAPMMNIHTVAAGGGSVLAYDGGRFRVGPDSAGANPGPACYRRGGPLCVTDCNVMLGKIQPEFFPHVFGPDAELPLDDAVVREKFALLGDETGKSSEAVAEGFLRIAVDNMANAVKQISVQRGYDVTEYTLCCFGGAGGQHACLVADALGMESIFVHAYAGVLSAYGMGLADLSVIKERSIEALLDPSRIEEIEKAFTDMAAEARAELIGQGVPARDIVTARTVRLRYQGTDTAIGVAAGGEAEMRRDFAESHRRQFGFVMEDRAVAVAEILLEASGGAEAIGEPEGAVSTPGPLPEPLSTVRMFTDGAAHATPVFDGPALRPGHKIMGPAILVDQNSTTVVEPGWQAEITAAGHLALRRVVARPRRHAIGTEADPIMLEIFNNLYMSIAEQMGSVLANTAHSVNIKERLDFSCAIFDAAGNLVANAPHMPVHLGSMGDSVRSVVRKWDGDIHQGDVFVVNAPYNGGTHLPDVTVITPVLGAGSAAIIFYVASRGHHADIGGVTPGSMPPHSTNINEEGVVLDNLRLVRAGRFLEDEIRDVLLSGPYPARNVEQNLADLRAQIAANEKGVRELGAMVGHFGLDVVQAYMAHVQDNAEEAVRRVIGTLTAGSFTYPMDNGGVIRVRVDVDARGRGATIDFSGTSEQLANNFNAPLSVCRAAALYVFRSLVDDDIPMNEGCLKPLDIIVAKGSMLNPEYPAAVVAGNVETSQAVVDTLYGALGVMGAAQGTMNNLTFGNARTQYYETICGGAGAGPSFDGADAVHTHMTNSRLTDPEILELRYPVVLEDFHIRLGSGGAGRHTGGDGVVRRLRFEAAMDVAILSGHRTVPPYGMAGGAPGALGRNLVIRKSGARREMAACDQVTVEAGDVVVIETPGGGGYGEAP
ncbi:hydantoinase B/oxoprolinase family protein [Varunaivibrio sulfuroxidans]|uniref:5-oxoprolinase (ATP-hydrolysing) n=1 Tax=Varunaivibrio sulfuroxidans TaxID=1773489 RepID=A0A4R3JBC2_9PROT|nr:hydantoinase B/oxoprolinase family protein [Varunaivibrio sulfuroxidans]TCS62917.1 5-oxoprolinase (ATP-hydrolysing) [Varunaivibrio sulfuroxidans]WES32004.1 hydantoinase B/oxoprolinase family protein [Varunaivibrio sulfuroxidans]